METSTPTGGHRREGGRSQAQGSSLGSEGFRSYNRHPSPRVWHQEDESFELVWTPVGVTWGLQEREIPVLERAHTWTSYPWSQCEGRRWRTGVLASLQDHPSTPQAHTGPLLQPLCLWCGSPLRRRLPLAENTCTLGDAWGQLRPQPYLWPDWRQPLPVSLWRAHTGENEVSSRTETSIAGARIFRCTWEGAEPA